MAGRPDAQDQKIEEYRERTRKEFVRRGGLKGAVLLKERGQNPLVKVANEVFQKQARRKVN